MDIEAILDAAEAEAPVLRDLARRFLDAEARHLGVLLDEGNVMARRAEGAPEVHVTGAADGLAKYSAAQPDALSDGSALMTLAYAGALSLGLRLVREAAEEGPASVGNQVEHLLI